ncbi:Guanine nucleotide exchange factor lte1 [Metarhizium rileyi]|uniref:Guanine nucleotide exchange factor lte1 n=1 Tax=Metarhizium rileyi (strain RCEF 4871) TaxID=1649241 RepID=A0A5C6GPF1_METRR|nr:Guanine nucleotide exchange factor lte1 [Metarhizium rileyi]
MNAADPLALTRPSKPGLSASTSLQQARSRAQTSPKRLAGNDTTTRRVSPQQLSSAAKENSSLLKPTATKRIARNIARGGSTASRPLVPLTERRSPEGKTQGLNDSDKWDIAPDGSSASREGRQFTVANVGNNGRIYLRPSVRPAHQRYPQPNFSFPITPPSTAVVDSWNPAERTRQDDTKNEDDTQNNLHTAQWTPTTSATPLVGDRDGLANTRAFSPAIRHRRAMSDSTVHEAKPDKEQEPHAYKVSISRLGERDELRPRTMDDLDEMTGIPMLNVNIPSWRLGTPRFSVRGTPMIRGSSCAPTEDLDYSTLSGCNPSSQVPNLSVPAISNRKPSPLSVPEHHSPLVARRGAPELPSPRLPRPMPSTYKSTHLVIEPAMFTDLTFQPARDDRAIVRYSSAGAVTAATPPRLVAEITSPCFLDYELISDFFLTFRSFLDATNLLRMLIARLRWALDRNDEVGMIVRVRTFVAIRHWILNYFVDDFLTDYDLRVTFCHLLNDFVDELCQGVNSKGVQLKILAELKKCWRRVCAQYWDGAEFDHLLGPGVAITPGGIAGNRDPRLDPATLEAQISAQEQMASTQQTFSNPKVAAFHSEIPQTMQVGDFVVLDNRPGTPESHVGKPVKLEHGTNSPQSLASMNIVSCSFPSRNIRAFSPKTDQIMTAHPVPSGLAGIASGPIATTPKTLMGKRVRPIQTHKRNNSLSDSLRDHNSDKASSTDQEAYTTAPTGGSLVRGNLLPPGHAFVDVESQNRYGHAHRQTTIFQPKSHGYFKEGPLGGAMSGYGMRKLLRSARKALRNKGHGLYSSNANLAGIPSVGPRGATTNRLPGTAVVPQQVTRQNGTRPPVRIDLLGAEVAEDFKKAIREEEEALAAAADGEQAGGRPSNPPNSAPLLSTYPEYSAAHMDTSTLDVLASDRKQRPVSDMGITVGSKSIVIVDDTVPFDMPLIHGTYRGESPLMNTFADSFTRHVTDPTPPNTPPEQSLLGGTPLRSSYLLNQRTNESPVGEEEILPPFIPDLATLEGSRHTMASDDKIRPTLLARGQSRHHPLSSGSAFRLHRRNQSSKTHQSLNSILHRQVTSYGSASVPPTVRSFDATAASSDLDSIHHSETSIPAPLRVLRRRPGGDLKAAAKVADLDRSVVRRSHSVSSFATFGESIHNSHMLGTRPNSAGEFEQSREQGTSGLTEVFSVGQLAERPPKRDLSLFSTHSSKPIMRPSFEAEAQKLAQIPDEEDDGIESALLKLEGKFPKQPPKPSIIGQSPDATRPEARTETLQRDVMNSHVYQPTEQTEHFQVVLDKQHSGKVRALSSFLSRASRDSYCSIPLLERGLDEMIKVSPRSWTDNSILRGSEDEDSLVFDEGQAFHPTHLAKHSSFDFVEKTHSIERIKPGDTVPSTASEVEVGPFLRDDGEDNTDLSSELSEDELGPRDVKGYNCPALDYGLPAHPLAQESTNQRPKTASAQITLTQALSMVPKGYDAGRTNSNTWPRKLLPPTPELTPIMGCTDAPLINEVTRSNALFGAAKHVMANPKKDALKEIDWKELIDMDWKHSANSYSRSWVDFLRNSDAQGVGVVIARFNIMVKWAISEIVLTQHLEERARCIIKLIHIASHCRRYRNFATLAQLTIALSSNEISRMSKTWELVPGNDLKTLSDLELLVTPSRNFHNIRREMEMGTDAGCIPFVGIYTHDLLYNAQKPSEIASSPTTAPLVNFERCRIGASVVKTLLRLLEASTRYTFQPIEGITERCLWIGALNDDDIRKHSQTLK